MRHYIVQERIAADKLLQYDALLVAALGFGCLLGGARPARRLLLRGLRQCTLLMTGVYLLSPLLQARQKRSVVVQAWSMHCLSKTVLITSRLACHGAHCDSPCGRSLLCGVADLDADDQHGHDRGHHGVSAADPPVPARLQLREQRHGQADRQRVVGRLGFRFCPAGQQATQPSAGVRTGVQPAVHRSVGYIWLCLVGFSAYAYMSLFLVQVLVSLHLYLLSLTFGGI